MNELEEPSFVNDNYNKKREQRKKIEKLRIYKKTIKLLAFGATLGIVAVNAPKIEQGIKNVAVSFIEHDNQKFEEETKAKIMETEELTGRSVEEIVESGKVK